MSEYSELIKNFGRIRDYMREFFVFGFKTRNDFNQKSKRTYDNERRRIENYLGNLTKWEYSENGKKIFISVDSSKIPSNPFYKAYKSKSFTDNDIILHFLILDILSGGGRFSLEEITDKINDRAEILFEPQTVRNKLKEYIEYGIITAEKEKKAHFYSLNKCDFEDLGISKDALNFFSEMAPFGVIGSFINDRINNKNTKFQFKHNFIVNTLEDNILLGIISAIKDQKRVEIENFSPRYENKSKFNILPLIIYVSVQTGRRYVIAQGKGKYRFSVYRLDYIKNVKILEKDENFEQLKSTLEECFKTSFSTALIREGRVEHFEMTLSLDEETEDYIIQRLEREGRGGKVEKIGDNLYKYSTDVYDTNELTPWIKTFIGRIVELKGDNKKVIRLFYSDIKQMLEMYGGENG
ncbi:WYL domain-containing protein [bacterium]|nr:WYL domain-containing protein [bacterium]